jgi:hypothetical protein
MDGVSGWRPAMYLFSSKRTRHSAAMNRRARSLFAALGLGAALALSSCASPTPYQPISSSSSSGGGFSERQLAPDYWQVSFAGNTLTSRETVEGYLLYRAAELTLQQGDEWFEIVNRETEHNVREEIDQPFYDSSYSPWWGYRYWRPHWSYYFGPRGWRSWDPYWGDPFFNTREVERYMATAEIAMGDGPPPTDGRRDVFSAREVIDRLASKIQRP